MAQHKTNEDLPSSPVTSQLIRIGLHSVIVLLATSMASTFAGCAWIWIIPSSTAEAAMTAPFEEDGNNAAYLEARLALATDYSEIAIEILEQCRRNNPESDERIYSTLAETYMSGNKLDKVREILDQGKKYHPESTRLLLLNAKWFRLNGKVDDAISILRTTHALSPGHQDIMEQLSDLYMYKIQNARTEEQINTEIARLITLYEDMAENRTGDEKWRVLIILSRFYLRQNMPSKALRAAREALEINPHELISLEELGKVQAALNDDENALKTFRQALYLQPGNKDIVDQIHEVLNRADDPQGKTRDFFTEMADECPAVREIQDRCIRLLISQKRFEEAEKRLNHVVVTWPEDNHSRVARLNLLVRIDRIDEASTEAIRMIREENSLTAVSALLIAEAMERHGDRAGAIQMLEIYNGHNSANEGIYVYLADLLKLEGRQEKALEFLGQYREKHPDSFLPVALIVELLREMERFDQAHELLDSVPESMLQKHGEDFNLLRSNLCLMQSDIYREGGRVAEAEKLDRQAIDLLETYYGSNQDSIVALKHVVDVLQRMQRFEEAHRKIDEMPSELYRENEGKIKQIRADLFLGQGSSHQDDGRLDEAESFYRKAMNEAPEYEEPLNALGYFYAETNQRLDEAHSLVTRALKIRPNAGHIVDSLGWILYHQGHYEEALNQLNLAVDLMPEGAGVAEVHEHIGDTHRKMGNSQQAHKSWERALGLDQKGIFIRPERIRNKIITTPN